MTDLIARVSGTNGQGKPVTLMDLDRVQLDELLNMSEGDSIVFNMVFFMPNATNGVLGKRIYQEVEFTYPVLSRSIRLIYFTIEKIRYYVNLE